MKTKVLIASLSLGLLVTLFYTSCKKSIVSKPNDYSASTENATADNAFSGIWAQVWKVANDSTNIHAPQSTNYPIVTISPWNVNNWPKNITINFGPTDLLCSDGVRRRGLIKATMSGRFTDSTTVITITDSAFYHNDNLVQGTETITNKGHISSGHLVYTVVVNNATITNTSGGITTWSTNQTRTWTQGESTPLNIFDDVWMISGTANGTTSTGNAYTIVTNSPLQVNIGCAWIVAGKFTLVMTNYPAYPITLDYGSGTCDDLATVVFNGTTYTVVML